MIFYLFLLRFYFILFIWYFIFFWVFYCNNCYPQPLATPLLMRFDNWYLLLFIFFFSTMTSISW